MGQAQGVEEGGSVARRGVLDAGSLRTAIRHHGRRSGPSEDRTFRHRDLPLTIVVSLALLLAIVGPIPSPPCVWVSSRECLTQHANAEQPSQHLPSWSLCGVCCLRTRAAWPRWRFAKI